MLKFTTITLFLCACTIVLNSCGNQNQTSTNPSFNTMAAQHPGKVLISKSDCYNCHLEKEAGVGPSFLAIAEKYANGDAAIVDQLAQKIIKGGSGVWGNVPMTAHAHLPNSDVVQMVNYILQFKNK